MYEDVEEKDTKGRLFFLQVRYLPEALDVRYHSQTFWRGKSFELGTYISLTTLKQEHRPLRPAEEHAVAPKENLDT